MELVAWCPRKGYGGGSCEKASWRDSERLEALAEPGLLLSQECQVKDRVMRVSMMIDG